MNTETKKDSLLKVIVIILLYVIGILGVCYMFLYSLDGELAVQDNREQAHIQHIQNNIQK